MTRAERAGALEHWLPLAAQHYRRAASEGATDEELGRLRRLALTRAESLRERFRSRAGRLWAAQVIERNTTPFVVDELKPGPLGEEQFAAVESGRARTLLDAMLDPLSGRSATSLDEQAARAEAEVMGYAPTSGMGDLLREEVRLTSLLSIGGPGGRFERAAAVRTVEAEYARLAVAPPAVADVATLRELRNALGPDELLVEYFVPHNDLNPAPEAWALVVASHRAEVLRLDIEGLTEAGEPGFIGRISRDDAAPIDVSLLGTLVVRARYAIRNSDDAAAAPGLRELARRLIQPVAATGLLSSARRLIVVPHAVLHYVPFATLPDDEGEPLLAAHAVTVAPSATAWVRMQAMRSAPVTNLLGLANPDLSYTTLRPLPEAERELTAICAQLAGVDALVKKGPEATERLLEQRAKGMSIVHLATHGDFPDDNALDMQRVLLAAGDGHDGAVHAEEIRRLDLSAARLVALSVCNGGLYRFGPGGEPYGLVPAVLAAGAENVLATLWPIEDEIGRLFMCDVYRRVLEDGPAEALRQTALEFREDGALTRQWAAFVAIGRGRPLT